MLPSTCVFNQFFLYAGQKNLADARVDRVILHRWTRHDRRRGLEPRYD